MGSLAAFGSDFKPLLGTDEALIDDKGRILVSKKKRERLGDSFVLSIGSDECIEAYPSQVWELKVAEIFSHDTLNQGTQRYSRLRLGSAEDGIKFDAQGRFVIPQKMRQEVGLKDRVLLVGCGERVEIWSKDVYERLMEQANKNRSEAINSAYREMKGL